MKTSAATFSEIVDAQRAELVVRLIEGQTRSLPAVAELLGFSAQSALARWFRERFGQSITQWRSQSNRKFLIENLYSICSANPGITHEKSQRTDGLAVHRKG